jgi:hypothetical protein
MQTVVETPSYLADAERLFSLDERKAIVDRLASDPTCGVVPVVVVFVKYGLASAHTVRAVARELSIYSLEQTCLYYFGGFCKEREGQSLGL